MHYAARQDVNSNRQREGQTNVHLFRVLWYTMRTWPYECKIAISWSGTQYNNKETAHSRKDRRNLYMYINILTN